MLVGGVVRQFLTLTGASFGPDADCTVMAKLVEQWVGVEIDGR
jgi:hypothetical protein